MEALRIAVELANDPTVQVLIPSSTWELGGFEYQVVRKSAVYGPKLFTQVFPIWECFRLVSV